MDEEGGAVITIQNIGPHDDPDRGGWRDYEVRINSDVICRFRHKRSDGLARCLARAAMTVENEQKGE